MIIPGPYRFTTITLAAAATQLTETINRKEGIKRATWFLDYVYVGGGSTVKCYLQTAVDDVTPRWMDISCIALTTSNAQRYVNLISGLGITTPGTPSDGALLDNTSINGLLAHAFRIKVISTGTYTGATLIRNWLEVE